MIALFLSSRPKAFQSLTVINWLTYLRILGKRKSFHKNASMCCTSISKSITQGWKFKGDESKQKTKNWTTLYAPVAAAVNQYLYTDCTYSITRFWIRSPVCLILLLYLQEVRGGQDLSPMNSSTLCCAQPIVQERLGEQELLVNQSLMWEPQRPRLQNCFSLILHVFELRSRSPWMWLLREPRWTASEEKAEYGGIKRERWMPLAFLYLGLSNHQAAPCMHNRLLQIWSQGSPAVGLFYSPRYYI